MSEHVGLCGSVSRLSCVCVNQIFAQRQTDSTTQFTLKRHDFQQFDATAQRAITDSTRFEQ